MTPVNCPSPTGQLGLRCRAVIPTPLSALFRLLVEPLLVAGAVVEVGPALLGVGFLPELDREFAAVLALSHNDQRLRIADQALAERVADIDLGEASRLHSDLAHLNDDFRGDLHAVDPKQFRLLAFHGALHIKRALLALQLDRPAGSSNWKALGR